MTALSPRELELANLVAIGHTNAQIARKLKISPQTVKNHIQSIYAKVRVRNRVLLSLKIAELRPRSNRRSSSRLAS